MDDPVHHYLKAEEARIFADAIIETLRQPLLVLDPQLRVVRANRAFYDSYALTPETTEGRSVYELGDRQWDNPQLRHLLEEILPKNTSFEDFEVRHDFAEQGERIMRLNARRLYDEHGKTQFILLAIEDVTERAQAQEALARQEQELRATLYSIGDAVISTDARGRVVRMNPEAERLTGWSEAEARGRPLEVVFHIVNEQTRKRPVNPVERVLREGVVVGLGNHTLLISRDGQEYAIADAGAPITDKTGKILGAVLIFRDQTRERAAQRALAEARIFADAIIETLRQPLLVLDPQLRVVRANRAFYDNYALTREATEGRPIYELGERQWDIPELRHLLEEILPKNTSFEDFQVRHDFAEQGERIMRLNARRLYDEHGKTQFILLAMEDVTERERLLERLARSERRFRTIVDNTLQGIVIVQDFRIVFANRAFADICGYTLEELYALPPERVRALVHPSDQDLVWGHYMRRLAGAEAPERYEYRGIRKDEEVVWLEMFARPIIYDGRPAVEGAVIDITERRRAQERMRWQAAALETAGNAIFMTDREGHIQWVNPAFTRLTGYTVEEVLGQTPRVLKSGVHSQDYYERLWKTILSGQVWRGETTDRRKDGSLFHAGMTITPLLDEQGRVTRFVSILEDITERKQARERLQQAVLEREALLRELYHRTKNNMQVILSWLSMEATRIGTPEVENSFMDLETRIQTMALVQQKLYESRNLSRINLKDYLEDLARMLYRTYDTTGGRIRLHLDIESLEALIDTAIPCGLLINELMSNAMKHAFPNGKAGEIGLRLYQAGPHEIEMEFWDNGVGLGPDVDLRRQNSLGVQNIFAIAETQMKGLVTYSGEKGLTWRIRLRTDLYEERV
ncbi:MAG: PAS domain S-box protein [Caldilineae bacterium]|nr:MAG: PAS domain S-box protein [Caldilineae bacterium]